MPLVAVLLAQIGLYIWMAPRGFDFTDEAYYFLNYADWRRLTGTVTFFGAYFELPFRMLGQSIPAIRILSMVLLLVSSTFFTRETLRFSSQNESVGIDVPVAFMAVGTSASLLYFGFGLRAPSYNLLALCSMLVATGLLLKLLRPLIPRANARVVVFFYGVAVGACVLGKASSGALLMICHVVFFALANRDWRPRHLVELVALSFAGVVLNFAMLQWMHPQWLQALREGVSMVGVVDGRGIVNLANALRWEIQAIIGVFLPWVVGALVIFGLLMRWIGPMQRAALSTVVVVLVAVCSLVLLWEGKTRLWLPMFGVAVIMLWGIEVFCHKRPRLSRVASADLGLTGLLFALPIAFSFGTNVSVLQHSQMAAVFVVIAVIVRLHRLSCVALLARPAQIISLLVLCIPPLVIQQRAALDVRYTYRQLSAFGSQTIPVHIGPASNAILVDAPTRDTLGLVIGAARAAGFTESQTVLDFTGDGPGLVYAMGARPLGVAWLLGGYPGSLAGASRLVASLPVQALQSAWLLTSDNNPRAISSWRSLLDPRLGAGAHEHVATLVIRAQYRWRLDAPENIDVQIWRPRVSSPSSRH